MGSMYKTTMSANSSNYPPPDGRNIEQMHTSDEIIRHATEILAQQMGLDLCSFVGLEEMLDRHDDGDTVYYIDKSGKRTAFTEELQLEAAIAVLNSNGHYFAATPVQENRTGA